MRASGSVAEAFGALLREARLNAELTQEELAHLAGLDRSTISQVERASAAPQLETLIRLAGGLQLDPCALVPAVRWEPPPPRSARPSGTFRQL